MARSPRRGPSLIVLTRDPLGRILRSVVVAPVTSVIRGLSTEVSVGPADGVRQEAAVNLDDVQLVGREAFRRRVGRAEPATLAAACTALAVAVRCEAAQGLRSGR